MDELTRLQRDNDEAIVTALGKLSDTIRAGQASIMQAITAAAERQNQTIADVAALQQGFRTLAERAKATASYYRS